ncbi:MAG: 16S rRNA (cytosine(1402)-N(4))-methyltransferase RsmH [Planctomycetota bacterium]
MDNNDARKPCHVSVMPAEVIEWVTEHNPKVIVDGTYGAGGHSRKLLEVLPADAILIGLDRDPAVFERTESEDLDDRLTVFLGSYEQISKALAACDAERADAIVLDLGLSSDQLADRGRGFSFQFPMSPLDLRFDDEEGTPASDWLLRHSESEIADTIYQFGEERFSRRIARAIVAKNKTDHPVRNVGDLVDICQSCVPRAKHHDIHPATRTFQALRIAVNDELGILQRTLAAAPDWLNAGGRFAAISFHSLEDRIVKNAFRGDERWEVLTRKPLRPDEEEIQMNPRSRSAKLRVAARVQTR